MSRELTKKQFDVLAFLAEEKDSLFQRQIEEKTGCLYSAFGMDCARCYFLCKAKEVFSK